MPTEIKQNQIDERVKLLDPSYTEFVFDSGFIKDTTKAFAPTLDLDDEGEFHLEQGLVRFFTLFYSREDLVNFFVEQFATEPKFAKTIVESINSALPGPIQVAINEGYKTLNPEVVVEASEPITNNTKPASSNTSTEAITLEQKKKAELAALADKFARPKAVSTPASEPVPQPPANNTPIKPVFTPTNNSVDVPTPEPTPVPQPPQPNNAETLAKPTDPAPANFDPNNIPKAVAIAGNKPMSTNSKPLASPDLPQTTNSDVDGPIQGYGQYRERFPTPTDNQPQTQTPDTPTETAKTNVANVPDFSNPQTGDNFQQ